MGLLGARPLYARAFDRFSGKDDPNAAYKMGDSDKQTAFRHGLLQLAAAMSKPNGGNFTQSVASGLLAGTNSMQDEKSQFANDAYRNDIMKRTQAEMAANTAKSQAWQKLYGADGNIDPAGEAALRQADPQGYLAEHDKLHPQSKWELKDVEFNGAKGSVYYNPVTNEARTLDGKPFGAAPTAQAAMPAPTTGGAPGLLNDAFFASQQRAESGNNPNAVSPVGAQGLMQIMPQTAHNPGFGMAPLPDNATPEQNAQFGRDYMSRITASVGGDPRAGLAAYNWGIGRVKHALAANHGDVNAVIAHAPPETQKYVAKVLSGAGQQVAAAGPALPFGFAKKADAENGPKLSPNYRWADSAHTKAEPIPGSEADQSATGLEPDAVRNLAYDQIFSGHRPPAGRNGGSSVYKSVENEVAKIAKDAGVSPMALSTQAGRTKVIMGTMAKLQTRASTIEAQSQTVAKNADYAASLQAKINPSQYPVINKYILSGKSNYMGDPNAAAFITAVNSVQTEYAKAMSGSTGAAPASDSAMAHARSLFNANMNPAQIAATVKAMKAEMDNQKESYNAELAGLASRAQEFGAQTVDPEKQAKAQQLLDEARAAIAKGADRNAVRQEMIRMGYTHSAGRL